MTGSGFLLLALMIALGLLALSSIAGMLYKRRKLDAQEAISLQLALEFSLSTTLFTVVPFAMSALFDPERVIWGMASLTMAVFFGVELARMTQFNRRYDARWPLAVISLLALCGIMLTIELVNFFWWGSPAAYIGGLLWMMTLAGLQLTAFMCYVPIQQDESDPYPIHHAATPAPVKPAYHRPDGLDRPEWMRRRDRADHPNRTPDASANGNTHADGDAGQRGNTHRLAFTRAPRSVSPLANATVRRDHNPRRRRN